MKRFILIVGLLFPLILNAQVGQNLIVKNIQTNGVLNVQMPKWAGGAKGDSSTDDRAAIQMVLDSVKNGQAIEFPKGNYMIKSMPGLVMTGKKNITIRGIGIGSALRSSGNDSINILVLKNCQNIIIENLSFYGGKTFNFATRIYNVSLWTKNITNPGCNTTPVDACRDVTVRGCYFREGSYFFMDDNGTNIKLIGNTFISDSTYFLPSGGGTNGPICIFYRGTRNSIIENNYFEDLKKNGVRGAVNAIWTGDGEQKSEGIIISNNVIYGFDWHTFETILWFSRKGAILGNRIIGRDYTHAGQAARRALDMSSTHSDSATVVANNYFSNVASGITVRDTYRTRNINQACAIDTVVAHQANFVIKGNIFEDMGEAAIQVSGDTTRGLIVSDNIIRRVHNYQSTANPAFGAGIGVFGIVEDAIVTNNLIYNTTKGAIYLATVRGGVVSNNRIYNAGMDSVDSHGIYLKGTNVSISGNTIQKTSGSGISVSGKANVSITANIIIDARTGADNAGIVLAEVNGGTVIGNVAFITDLINGQDYGLKLSSDTNIVVLGNDFHKNRLGAIAISGDSSTINLGFNKGDNRPVNLQLASFSKYLTFEKNRGQNKFADFYLDSTNATSLQFRITLGKMGSLSTDYGFIFGDSIAAQAQVGGSSGLVVANLNLQRGAIVGVMTNTPVHNTNLTTPQYSFILGSHDSNKVEVARISVKTDGMQNKGGGLVFHTKDSSGALTNRAEISATGSLQIADGQTVNYAGSATLGAGDSVNVSQTGVTATSLIFTNYVNITAADSTLGPLGIRNRATGSFTIRGLNGNGKTVFWWIAQK